MGDISNKTLAILVVIAIIVSLIGLFVGRRVVTVGRAPDVPGEVKANVEADIDLTISGSPLDFGDVFAGDIISSESDDSPPSADPNCPIPADCNKYFIGGPAMLTITNIGATPANIDYLGDASIFDRKWDLFDNVGDLEEDESFGAKVKATAIAGILNPCDNGLAIGWIEGTFRDVWIDVVGYQGIVEYCSQNDYFEMFFKIKVPLNEPTVGAGRTTTLTFLGTSAV